MATYASAIVDMCTASSDGARMKAQVFFPLEVNYQLRTGADKGNPTV